MYFLSSPDNRLYYNSRASYTSTHINCGTHNTCFYKELVRVWLTELVISEVLVALCVVTHAMKRVVSHRIGKKPWEVIFKLKNITF